MADGGPIAPGTYLPDVFQHSTHVLCILCPPPPSVDSRTSTAGNNIDRAPTAATPQAAPGKTSEATLGTTAWIFRNRDAPRTIAASHRILSVFWTLGCPRDPQPAIPSPEAARPAPRRGTDGGGGAEGDGKTPRCCSPRAAVAGRGHEQACGRRGRSGCCRPGHGCFSSSRWLGQYYYYGGALEALRRTCTSLTSPPMRSLGVAAHLANMLAPQVLLLGPVEIAHGDDTKRTSIMDLASQDSRRLQQPRPPPSQLVDHPTRGPQPHQVHNQGAEERGTSPHPHPAQGCLQVPPEIL
jgi:hypothetical protein